jgi:hypothetical protein
MENGLREKLFFRWDANLLLIQFIVLYAFDWQRFMVLPVYSPAMSVSIIKAKDYQNWYS